MFCARSSSLEAPSQQRGVVALGVSEVPLLMLLTVKLLGQRKSAQWDGLACT